ncbi:MAG: AAA family ATPase [Candidatus Diapherotrites archaeon]|nr:AAA family ATPase [Candidatus Micrarchaeota archaeon]
MRTIIVVGLARSGKDTAAEMLAEMLGCAKYNLSDVLADELKAQGKSVDKEALARLGDEMRAKHGMAIVAERLMERIPKNKDAVISGARSEGEVEHIKRERNGAVVLEVYAEEDARFARRSGRDPEERERFFARDKADIEKKGLKKVLEGADFRVVNNSSMDELRKELDKLIRNI